MNNHKASDAAGASDAFYNVAKDHRADVARIREKNRRRRLRYLAYLAILVGLFVLRRYINKNPISFGWPDLGPDAMLWLFPFLMLLVISLAVILPLTINGRSPHIRYSPEEIGIGFQDVKGLEIVLEEVTRTLQIFLTYKTFREELGGNPRRGLLFEGHPGTGKTHMAKAMAKEAGVPFFFVSAPAFTNMFQGASSRRVRGFFKALKKAAAKEGGAIGFIEEIDAVGRARGGTHAFSSYGPSGMTLSRMGAPGDSATMVNELLIQMQSFDEPPFGRRMKHGMINAINSFLPARRQIKKTAPSYNNVLIIGATNLASALDPALLRPGRFDRTLYFDVPSKLGRRELLDYFLARRAHDPEMDREDLREEFAAMTIGHTPAMVEHILDEALVWALRESRVELNWRDIQRARLSEEIGLAQPVAYTDRERDLIATHEAGHAVAAYLCAKDRKLEVLSIIKRRQALGLLAHSDAEERFTRTKSELESTLKVALAGMAAEKLFFGESGTGPASDLTAATELAAQMVGAFGMGSSLISYDAASNGQSGPNIVAKVLSSDDAKREVEDIMRRHQDQVAYLLERNRDILEALRDALLVQEELMGDEIAACIEEALARRRQHSAEPSANGPS
jgi:cell division protease FtsH